VRRYASFTETDMNIFFLKKVVNIHLSKFLLSGLQKWKTDLGKNIKFHKLFYIVKKIRTCLGPLNELKIVKT